MHYFLLIYFVNKPLHVSSSLATHHQEDQLCHKQQLAWSCVTLTGCWQDRDGSCQQPVNVTHDYTNCCLWQIWSSWWWAARLLETCRGLLMK